MFTLIFIKEKILNCGSKPDEIGFQNAETTCKIVHNELIWRWQFNEVTGPKF